MNEKSHPYFFCEKVEVCKAGLEFVRRKWAVAEFFLKVRIAKMRVLGWLDAFRAVKWL